MARLEDKRLYEKGDIFKWSRVPPCAERCGTTCVKALDRCMCVWRGEVGFNQHLKAMDGLLMKYKGYVEVEEKSFLFVPRRQCARKNAYRSEPMEWGEKGYYKKNESIDERFRLLQNRNEDAYKDGDNGYETDVGADSEEYDSDEDIHNPTSHLNKPIQEKEKIRNYRRKRRNKKL
eukprot:GHVL01040692.1.p1 GENE.GHVL01040692.1~~GHVL01040692.1.p1  ORF type:complete len:176 (+),score=39.75 GHVL01040692.1:98-625(+)